MELLLKKQELLDLGNDLRGVTIHCRSGCCWLTQADDSRDHILQAGASFRVRGRGQLLVTASNACRLELVAAPATERPFSWRQLCYSN